MQQEQHDHDAQQLQLQRLKQGPDQKRKPQTGSHGVHASPPLTPAAAPRGELMRQVHHMQQRTQPSPCNINA
jgi:hypothetical protein